MSLIINRPWVRPEQHWVEGQGGKLEIKAERRPASYDVFDARRNTRRTEVLDMVNTIRTRVDRTNVETLTFDPASTPIRADLAPALGGATDLGKMISIDLKKLPDGFRLQRLMFQAARKGFAEMNHNFKGSEGLLAAQPVRIVEAFIKSDVLQIPSLFHSDPLRLRILIALNIDLIVQHLMQRVTEQNRTMLTPTFDEENPIGSTGQMRTWYTIKPNFPAARSHISHLDGDSFWEGYAANIFEKSDDVLAYAKNDHLGFQVQYLWSGSRRRYVPDFLVKFNGGTILALEIKGTDSPQNRTKRAALAEWVEAVNAAGGFRQWSWDVAFDRGDIEDIIERHHTSSERHIRTMEGANHGA